MMTVLSNPLWIPAIALGICILAVVCGAVERHKGPVNR